MSIAVLRQMFEQMVENKDPTATDRFYHPSFVMFSNGVTQDFEAFAASHRTIYATPICYSVEYDEQAWGRGDRQGRRPGVDHDQPPGREPHSYRGRVDRRFHRRPDQPRLGDDVAELEHIASIRDLLIQRVLRIRRHGADHAHLRILSA